MPEVRRSSSAKPRHPKRKPRPRRLRHHGFTPTLVIEPSPTLPGSATTENEMLFWVGCFYRLHQRRKRLIPVHIKTLDCPVAMADGSVLVVEIARGTLSRVTPDGRIHVVADLGGGPNGAAIGPDGAVYVCNNGGFRYTSQPGDCLRPVAQAGCRRITDGQHGVVKAGEQLPGFEPRDPVVSPRDPNGGIKGKRKSKKDKLREAAAAAGKPPTDGD
mgnify:CR=1 FL=1